MFVHLSNHFKDETWEFILILLMGISDHLFI